MLFFFLSDTYLGEQEVMTVKESRVPLMHGSDGKSQSTEGGGVLCHGSEVCDS